MASKKIQNSKLNARNEDLQLEAGVDPATGNALNDGAGSPAAFRDDLITRSLAASSGYSGRDEVADAQALLERFDGQE